MRGRGKKGCIVRIVRIASISAIKQAVILEIGLGWELGEVDK